MDNTKVSQSMADIDPEYENLLEAMHSLRWHFDSLTLKGGLIQGRIDCIANFFDILGVVEYRIKETYKARNELLRVGDIVDDLHMDVWALIQTQNERLHSQLDTLNDVLSFKVGDYFLVREGEHLTGVINLALDFLAMLDYEVRYLED